MRPLAKLDGLMHHVHSTDDDSRVKVDGSTKYTKLLRNLESEFTVEV